MDINTRRYEQTQSKYEQSLKIFNSSVFHMGQFPVVGNVEFRVVDPLHAVLVPLFGAVKNQRVHLQVELIDEVLRSVPYFLKVAQTQTADAMDPGTVALVPFVPPFLHPRHALLVLLSA